MNELSPAIVARPSLIPVAAPDVGRDLAIASGKVVLRNALMELIQYAPTTPTVRSEPVLIVPAWITQYPILDRSPQNSLTGWLVDQGHTVFAISWRNSGEEIRDVSLDDYRMHGVMAALEAVDDICGEVKTHAVGYCLGGTLLSIAAAAMGRDAYERLASVTLFATQTDFTEAGELQLFLTDSQLHSLQGLMREGYRGSRPTASALQSLGCHDLFWPRAPQLL